VTPPQPPEKKTLKEELIAWAKALGSALLIWIVLRSFLVEAFRIPSPSMENTLLVGDFLFVSKMTFGGELEIPVVNLHCCRLPGTGSPPRRQEVIVFRSVEDSTPDLNIVKRLIGEPGDTLQMVRDTLIRNGQRLDEPYALHTDPVSDSLSDGMYRPQMRTIQLPQYVGKDPARYHPSSHDWGPIVVPPDHYWVMGDNRDKSYDSRYWGFLPRANIRGRPLIIYMSVATRPFRIRWNRLLRHPR
jgi:signal peptidase I